MREYLLAAFFLILLLGGCTRKEVKQMEVDSPAFEDGGMIPERFGYTEENVSPPLEFSGVPEDAENLVILMDDPDAKSVAGKVWDHWVVWNIPASVRMIGEDNIPPEAVEGRNDFGETGYGGPNPPDKTHEYRIRVYALGSDIELSRGATLVDVRGAMDGKVVEKAEMTGKYPAD